MTESRNFRVMKGVSRCLLVKGPHRGAGARTRVRASASTRLRHKNVPHAGSSRGTDTCGRSIIRYCLLFTMRFTTKSVKSPPRKRIIRVSKRPRVFPRDCVTCARPARGRGVGGGDSESSLAVINVRDARRKVCANRGASKHER